MAGWLLNMLLFLMSHQADDLPVGDQIHPASGTNDLHRASLAGHDTRDTVTRAEIAKLFGNGLRER